MIARADGHRDRAAAGRRRPTRQRATEGAREAARRSAAARARSAAQRAGDLSARGLGSARDGRGVSRRGRVLGAELQRVRPLGRRSSRSRARPRARWPAASIDVALGGASLLLGAGIGAAVGAFGTLAGAGRLAKVRVLGQPLGGYELQRRADHGSELAVGAARPRAAAREARRRAQSRTARGVRASTRKPARISRARSTPKRRGTLEVVFRTLRKGQAIDARDRAALIGELAPLIERP